MNSALICSYMSFFRTYSQSITLSYSSNISG
nr:MAG TPA: hypothetical protein [Caudoviricetes sp.]